MKSSIILLSALCSSALAVSDVIHITAPALFPESIDLDTETNTLIAGSLSQGVIVSVSFEGVVSPFINDTDVSGAGRGVIGVQVDSTNRIVWACVRDLSYEENLNAFAGIAAYSLDGNRDRVFLSQLNGIDPAGDPRGVTCNDVVHTADGTNAYLTDSFGDRIYKVSSTGDVTLETADTLLAKNDPDKEFGINGIEINAQNELIISQQANGKLLKYSLETKVVTEITGLPLIGGDGIIFTNEARTMIAVTDFPTGTVYIIALDGNVGKVVESKKVAPDEVITCTVVIEGQVYALSAYLMEFFTGLLTRQDFPLTKVAFDLYVTTTATATPTSSAESLRIVSCLIFAVMTLV
jgi:hypothetical protein